MDDLQFRVRKIVNGYLVLSSAGQYFCLDKEAVLDYLQKIVIRQIKD